MLYLKNKFIFGKHLLVIPVLTALAIPILLLDICAEAYHRICFPLYGLPYIKRCVHIKVLDRGKLKYLSFWQKLYCMYCGYANGIVQYWMEMGAVTEKYWCGIAHEKSDGFVEHQHHKNFARYGDKNEFIEKYTK